MENSLCAYIPATNLSTAGNYIDVAVNSLYHPFQTTYVVNTAANTYSFHGNYTNGFSATVNPPGYAELATLYQLYKVLKWELVVTVQPQGGDTAVKIVVLPLGNEEIPSSSASYVNLLVMEGAPRSRSKICASGAPASAQTVRLAEPTYITLGKRRSQWLDLNGTLMAGQPSEIAYAGIFIQTVSGASNTNPMPLIVTLRQTVELTDLFPQII
jgi:hypothetical protein